MAPTAREKDPEKGKTSHDRPPKKQATFDWELFKLIFSVTITCPLLWILVFKCVLSPLDACHITIQRFDGNFCRSPMDSETVIVFKADHGPVCQAWSDEGRNASYTAVQLEQAGIDKMADHLRREWKGDVFGAYNVTPH